MTVKSNLIQMGLIGSSSKCSLPPSPSRAQLVNLNFSELSSEIQNYFEPEPSQARILTLSPSRAEPAQLELFGSSQLELEPARYTLPCCHLVLALLLAPCSPSPLEPVLLQHVQHAGESGGAPPLVAGGRLVDRAVEGQIRKSLI